MADDLQGRERGAAPVVNGERGWEGIRNRFSCDVNSCKYWTEFGAQGLNSGGRRARITGAAEPSTNIDNITEGDFCKDEGIPAFNDH